MAGLTLVNTGDTFFAGTINQLIDVLQREAGQQEIGGHYIIAGNSYTATGLFQSTYISSRSRNSVPVSASVDASDAAMTNLNSPTIGHLTMGGSQVFASASSANGNCFGGGLITFQF